MSDTTNNYNVPSSVSEDLGVLTTLLNIPDRKLSSQEYRKWICETEDKIRENNVTTDRHSCLSAGYKLEEAITPGIYTRELTMPKGALVFSRIHRGEHPFMVTKGLVSVYDGESVQTIEAPYKGITKAGTKRVLYVHEETTWITFHPTNSSSIEEIELEDKITCDTFDDYESRLLEDIR